MSTYLVTGGAGFIGSHLAEELVRRGHTVRVADSLITGKRSNLDHFPAVEFLEGDLADVEFAQRAVRGLRLRPAPGGDSFGAAVGQGSDHLESRQRGRDAERPGRGARRRRQAPRLRRLLVRLRQHANAAEARGHADQPAVALRAAEGGRRAVLQMFTRLYGLETVSIRYFNVFGPRQDPTSPYSGVISVFATALLENRSPTIYGDGGQTRDFTYVANVVDGVLRACEAPRRQR